MPTQKSRRSENRTWSFWTSALWVLEVAPPAARRSPTRFVEANGLPTLVAQRISRELRLLEEVAGDEEFEIFVADRTTFFHAVLWWVGADPLLPGSLVRPQRPLSAMTVFGSALRERFGSMTAIHEALLSIARKRAPWRDDVLTADGLRNANVSRMLEGLPEV